MEKISILNLKWVIFLYVCKITQLISDITGQVSIYFVDTDNHNKPFSYIDRNDNSASSYSFALSFTSSDGSFSFSTSVFSGSYMVNLLIFSHYISLFLSKRQQEILGWLLFLPWFLSLFQSFHGVSRIYGTR